MCPDLCVCARCSRAFVDEQFPRSAFPPALMSKSPNWRKPPSHTLAWITHILVKMVYCHHKKLPISPHLFPYSQRRHFRERNAHLFRPRLCHFGIYFFAFTESGFVYELLFDIVVGCSLRRSWLWGTSEIWSHPQTVTEIERLRRTKRV